MAATSTNVVRGDAGAFILTIDDITLDSSYPSGGYTLPTSLPLTTVYGMSQVAGGSGYIAQYNTSTGKLQIYQAGAISTTSTPTVTVVGSQSAGSALQITPATANAGVLGTTAAVATQTIPASTFGLTLNLGTSSAAALAQVTTSASLAGVVVRMASFGY